MSNRNFELGYETVAMHDPVGRRGLWYRQFPYAMRSPITAIELCAGREGNDSHVKLVVGEVLTEERISELADVFGSAKWAYNLGVEEPTTIEHWAAAAHTLLEEKLSMAQSLIIENKLRLSLEDEREKLIIEISELESKIAQQELRPLQATDSERRDILESVRVELQKMVRHIPIMAHSYDDPAKQVSRLASSFISTLEAHDMVRERAILAEEKLKTLEKLLPSIKEVAGYAMEDALANGFNNDELSLFREVKSALEKLSAPPVSLPVSLVSPAEAK